MPETIGRGPSCARATKKSNILLNLVVIVIGSIRAHTHIPVDDGAEEERGGDEELGDQAAAAARHGGRLPEHGRVRKV